MRASNSVDFDMRRRDASSEGLAGTLLLAHPQLRDPNFFRTVVLMSVHNSEGALGVVLNRPLGKTVGDLGPEFAGTPLASVPVYGGGPVNPDQLILVAWEHEPQEGAFKLYFGLEPSKLEELSHRPGLQVRAFLGYSGWSGGQLENEMKHRSWLVSALPADLLGRAEGADLWRQALGALGPEWRLQAGEPDDPARN
jgi:putative transcriptional regulator